MATTTPIEFDSLGDFTAAFTGETTGNSEGRWSFDEGGSTVSGNTGPGTNNQLPFVHTETSGGGTWDGEANGRADIADVPAQTGRILHLRACVQGLFGDGTEGLEIQHRADSAGEWAQAGFIHGWSYSDAYEAGGTVTDENNVERTFAARGGWIDFAISIPDTATQVRLQPRYIFQSQRWTHDIALHRMHWSWPDAHAINVVVDMPAARGSAFLLAAASPINVAVDMPAIPGQTISRAAASPIDVAVDMPAARGAVLWRVRARPINVVVDMPRPNAGVASVAAASPINVAVDMPQALGRAPITHPGGPAFGDLVLLERTSRSIYVLRNGAWDEGNEVPAWADTPRDVAVDPVTGDLLLVARHARARDYAVIRKRAGAWDEDGRLPLPAGVTDTGGMAADLTTGDISLIDQATDQIHTHNGIDWTAPVAGPVGENRLRGLAYTVTGDLVLIGDRTQAVYVRRGAAWRRLIPLPNANTHNALAVEPYANRITVYDNVAHRIYALHDGGRWETAARAPALRAADVLSMAYAGHKPSPAAVWPPDLAAQPPLLAVAEPDGDHALDVRWRPHAHALRHEYAVTLAGQRQHWMALPADAGHVQVGGLIPYHVYVVEVRAVTVAGPQPASRITHSMRPVARPVAAPPGVHIPMLDETRQSATLRIGGRDIRLTVVWAPSSVLGAEAGFWHAMLEIPINTVIVQGMRLTTNSGLLDRLPGYLPGDIVVRSLTGQPHQPGRDAWRTPTHGLWWVPA